MAEVEVEAVDPLPPQGLSSRLASMEAACSNADKSLLDRMLKMQIAITVSLLFCGMSRHRTCILWIL